MVLLLINRKSYRRKRMNADKVLEFDLLKEKWKDLAMTAFAKEEIDKVTPFLSEVKLKKSMRETSESKEMIEKLKTPPFVSMDGLDKILMTVKKGECLSPIQLESVLSTLIAVKRLKEYLNRGKAYELSLAFYEDNLKDCKELSESISLQIRNHFVDDHASKLLSDTKNKIIIAEEKMKEKADSILKKNKIYMSDSFTTLRNGHICLPVKSEYKAKINGSTLDKSSSGNTFFIEPSSVGNYYEQIQYLKIEQENEEYRILYALTVRVEEYMDLMEENKRIMELLDFIFSKGKLSIDMAAVEPKINTERVIKLKNARHPFMEKENCIPIQFQLGKAANGIVITGPNTGGKTVTIKTVALNCMMAQCGLHVTCEEADICMNSNFLCDIGDGQNLSENLSTFSAHIKNVLDIFSNLQKDSLVIMDELGSGTDPAEGMGIAIAILEQLRRSGCLFLVTTHYPEVKNYAKEADGILNAKMTFEKESLRPLYQLIIGEAGESCAFYIAKRLGMSEELLQIAQVAAYGKEEEKHSIYKYEQKTAPKSQIKIQKEKKSLNRDQFLDKFQIGDSVMVYPEKKIGIVCQSINEKGVLQIQMRDRKIWKNHKRVKLHVKSNQLYPKDYDFSQIFETVEERKLHHDMSRKYVEDVIIYDSTKQKE